MASRPREVITAGAPWPAHYTFGPALRVDNMVFISGTTGTGPDGRVRLAVGAAGGPTIPAQVIKAIIGVIDWKMSAQAAIAAPEIFAPSGPTVYVEEGTPLAAMIPALTALGHGSVKTVPPETFKANAIEWTGGRWVGGADPRSEGVAVSQ